MKDLRDFDWFIKKEIVKKQSPDKNLSDATYKESLDRIELAKHLLGKEKSKYILENAYEAMREAADAILYKEGYKSYSHEASIVYLLKKGFSERDVFELDRFRRIRNDIKYYGKDCEEKESRDAITLAERIIPKVKEILRKQ